MKKTATVVLSILFAFAAIAAGTSESSKPVTAAAEYDGPVSMVKNQPAPEHDYKLERESCCGPQE